MNNKFKICVLGFFIGFLSGLFSSGGGIVALVCFSSVLKFPEKQSRAMTIFCILPIVLASILIYNNAHLIDFNLGFLCAVGGLIGGWLGSILLDRISDKYLDLIFIVFLAYSAYRMFIS